jgi:hypothetical protein
MKSMTFLRRTAAVLIATMIAGSAWTADASAQLPKPIKETDMKAAGGRQSTGAEVSQALVGNTAYIVFLANVDNVRSGTVLPMYFRDPKTRVQLLPNRTKQEANWWVDGNTLCLEQRNINLGHRCYTWWELQNVRYFCLQPGGICDTIMRVVPGNPEGM